jgi:signal peptidase II
MTMLKNNKCHFGWIAFSMLWIVIDQITKYLAVNHLVYGQPKVILPVLNFTLSFNNGAAFGMFNDQPGWQIIFFSVLAIVVCGFLINYLFRTPCEKRCRLLGLSLVIAGAIGNLIDRLWHHTVIDFISCHVGDWSFAIFNVADACITMGVIALLISMHSKWSQS